jgi:DNA replication protein DnaC
MTVITASRQQELEALLQALRLPSFVKHYQGLARQAEKEKMDNVGYLYQLSRVENEERYHRRTERLLKEAKLPRGKRLDDFDLSKQPTLSPSRVRELSEGSFIDQCENVLIFGNPGTGKTHLSIGLAREWCLHGRRIYFTTAAAVVQDLLAAKRDLRLNSLLKKLDRFEVLVIDDLSYIPHDREETDVLFLLLAERYEQRSIVITSNLAFSQWERIFKDPITTVAAIDRLVHHDTILELNGESYRKAEANRRKKKSDTQNGEE